MMRKVYFSICCKLVIAATVLLGGLPAVQAQVFIYSGGPAGNIANSGDWQLAAGTAHLSESTYFINAAEGDVTLSVPRNFPVTRIAVYGPHAVNFTGEGAIAAQSKLVSLGASGKTQLLEAERASSCSFFTIVNTSTSPTCNGLTNGVASVATPTDGVGPYAYQWISGPASQTWPGRGAGTYTIIIFDLGQGGVPCSADIFINEPAPIALFSLNGTPPNCPGVCNGSALPVVIGGNGGFTYSWSSGETGINPTQLCETFNLLVTDVNGCTLDTTVMFGNAPDPFVFNAVAQPEQCAGAGDGSITTNFQGGTPPYDYAWSGPGGFTATTSNIANLEPGQYVLEVTDGNSCTIDTLIEVEFFPLLDVVATGTDNVCPLGTSGSIATTITGGNPPYTFVWTGPNGFSSGAEDLNNLASGVYDLLVTDANGCEQNATVTISEPDEIVISLTTDSVNCFGGSDGSISTSVSGGTPPFTYSWTGPNGFTSSTQSPSGLVAGTYQVTVEDSEGCLVAAPAQIDVLEPTDFAVSEVITPITCNNGSDGAITVAVSGASPPYTLLWNGPGGFTSSNSAISGLEAGVFTLLITDANACDTLLQYELLNPLAFTFDVAATNLNCFEDASGSISVVVSGGLEPYTYAWSGPNGFNAATASITGLAAGSYTLEVTDDNGCSEQTTVLLTQPDELELTALVDGNVCAGDSLGEIDITLTGGTSPYTYAWLQNGNPFSSSADLTDLPAGIYSLQATDANGCTRDSVFEIEDQFSLVLDGVVTNLSCAGDDSGAISTTPSGGSAPYTVAWSGPNGFTATGTSLANLAAGIYSAELTDANGCEALFDFQVTSPDSLEVVFTADNSLCEDVNDGEVSAAVSGGTAPFTYAWQGPAGFTSSASSLTNLLAGWYTLQVEDAAGCLLTDSVEITNDLIVQLDATVTNLLCFDDSTGQLDVTALNGLAPYTFSITGPGGFASASPSNGDLAAGTYAVFVEDDQGCVAAANYTLSQPSLLQSPIATTDPLCAGDTNGALQTTPTGGTAPYGFAWTGPNGFTSSAQNLSALETGTYTLVVTDANGCETNENALITAPDSLNLTVTAVEPSCTVNDGSLTANVTGGTSPYNYSWQQGGTEISTAVSATNLGPGQYTLEVEDANGCLVQDTLLLSTTEISADSLIIPVTCHNGDDGAIKLELSGGTVPYTYSWVGPNGFTDDEFSIAQLEPGTYTLTATDAEGCVYIQSVTLSNPLLPEVTADLTNVLCAGGFDGAISIDIEGGNNQFGIAWSGPDGYSATADAIAGLQAGDYTLLYTNVLGCTYDTLFTLTSPDSIEVSLDNTPVTCAGASDGELSAAVSGGAGGYVYSWTGPNGFVASTSAIASLQPGPYQLMVTDANGCAELVEAEVLSPDSLLIDLTIINSNCLASTGQAEALPNGGVQPYTWQWEDEDGVIISTDTSATGLEAGIYTVTVTDAAGCVTTEIVPISDSGADLQTVSTPTTCPDNEDGGIVLTVVGAQEPFTIAWSGPDGFTSDNDTLTNLAPGVYAVTVFDAAGCIYSASQTVNAATPTVVVPAVTDASCAGNDGSITITVSGGAAPYSFAWTDSGSFSSISQNIANLVPATYTVTVEDANGCLRSTPIEVGQNDPLSVSATLQEPLCAGDDLGAINLNPLGGAGNYSFNWIGPDGFSASTQSIAGLAAGDYALTLTDQAGCTFDTTLTVVEPPALQASVTALQPTCTLSDGELSAIAQGGVPPYSFEWSDGAGNVYGTSVSLTELGTGLYVLQITDGNGCTTDTTLALSNTEVSISADVLPAGCAGQAEGAIDITVTSGVAPYNFSWIGPSGFTASTEDIANLAPGTYTVSLTDSEGCSYIEQFVIEPLEGLEIVTIITPIGCTPGEPGSIQAVVNGGTSPFAYSWTGPNGFTAATQEITTSDPGTYTVSITDGNGCTDNASITLFTGETLELSVAVSPPLCAGEPTGTLTATATGSNPFEYTWQLGGATVGTDATLGDAAAGTYTLTVEDIQGCSRDTTIELLEPETLVAGAITEPVFCTDGSGTLTALPTGGTLPYSYYWILDGDTVSTDSLFTTSVTGAYTLALADGNGCSATASVTLETGEELTFTATVTPVSCAGAQDGAIDLSLVGGGENVQINWILPSGETATGELGDTLEAGEYILQITYGVGCEANDTLSIGEPEPLVLNFIDAADAVCSGDSSGSAAVFASGGTGDYTYTWLLGGEPYPGATANQAFNLVAGTYQVVATDEAGCTASLDIEIGNLLVVEANAGADFGICASSDSVLVSGSGVGNTSGFWGALDGTIVLNAETGYVQLPAASPLELVFTALASETCFARDTLVVEIQSSPDADAGPDREVTLDEQFTLGGAPTSPTGVSYNWSPGFWLNDSTTANPTGTLTETVSFVVLVTDANGCQNTDTVQVEFIPELIIPSGFTPNGDGFNDTWVIDNIGQFPGNEVFILNRWGDVLYNVTNYTEGNAWDGRYEGNPLPVGTYYYIIELNDARFPEPLNGPITLFR